MKSHRIFIEHLPETASESDIHSKFSSYGVVTSVEIKERKNVTFKNSSLFFAYVNLETDELSLQKCFKQFNEHPWNGEYVKIQIAKESFLERLKREREANLSKTPTGNTKPDGQNTKTNNIIPEVLEKPETFILSEESKICKSKFNNTSKEEKKIIDSFKECSDIKESRLNINDSKASNKLIDEVPFMSDIIVKSNKGVSIEGNKLKIEGVGKSPIHNTAITQNKQRSLDKYRKEADSRRLNSLLEKKKEYNHQKNAIQAALSYKNMTKLNKKIFDDNEENINETPTPTSESKLNYSKKTPLFDNENNSESDEDPNTVFQVREKFQGKAGEQLLKLQSTFKNDKRFRLDEKFLENDVQNEESMVVEDWEDVNIEEEKKKEYEILGEVLGREIKSYRESNENNAREQNRIKGMRRYDPSNPDHAKYEREKDDKPPKKKRKENLNNDKQVENKEEPEVSKEVFYTVRDDLKKSLEEDKGFSLLSTFGMSYDKDDVPSENDAIPIEKKKYITEDPFKYESSDDEDQTEQLAKKQNSSAKGPNTIRAWTEPFFFQEDDYRLQDGIDFMKRLATETKNDFQEIRTKLKEIAKSKVRKNQRKNRAFKKKLGGNRRKKEKRMNKALKR